MRPRATRSDQARVDSTGIQLSLHGHAPLSAYAFYYGNLPNFYKSNLTLRIAIAPVYLDSEVGLVSLLGEYTDLGLGINGGGFADSYAEIRQGKYLREESFTGHGVAFPPVSIICSIQGTGSRSTGLCAPSFIRRCFRATKRRRQF